jgi:hypothetical protein
MEVHSFSRALPSILLEDAARKLKETHVYLILRKKREG